MKKHSLIPISFLVLAAALTFIPLVAAQDTTMLTDGLSNIWGTLSAVPGQISQFAAEQPLATGALTATGTAAGVGGVGWKLASTAKNKLQSAYNSLKGNLDSAQQKASGAVDQLNSYKTQAETQLNNYKTQAETALQTTEQYKEKLGSVQSNLETVTAQKASLLNEVEDLRSRLKTATDQLAVLTPKVK